MRRYPVEVILFFKIVKITHRLTTCECHIKTIISRASKDKAHKLVLSLYTHKFWEAFIEEIRPKEANAEREAQEAAAARAVLDAQAGQAALPMPGAQGGQCNQRRHS